MIAYVPGICSECGETIERGDGFEWGRNRGDRLHSQCASGNGARSGGAGGHTAESAPVPATEVVYSSFQSAIFDHGLDGRGSAVIEAVAGSGKTKTIEELCRRLFAARPGISIVYLVFNKRNAEEANRRMPAGVRASTFHSACNAALSQRLERPKIDKHKCRRLWNDMVSFGMVNEQEADALGPAVQKLISLAKNIGIGCLAPDTFETWNELIEHHDIQIGTVGDPNMGGMDEEQATKRVIELTQQLLLASNKRVDVIDFDDMLCLTVKLAVPLPRYEIVCVDEAQDTNAIQRAVLKMMLVPGGRLYAVGDRRQSIYGFRGADSNAMDLIAQDFGCCALPLSINYRCAKRVVEAAQRFCPELQAWEQSPDGNVRHVSRIGRRDFRATDAILCRVTAPLITEAYRFLATGVGCTVLGRDIGEGLVNLIEKLRGKKSSMSIDEMLAKLDDYRRREVTRWTARGDDDKAQAITDKSESIYAAVDALPDDRQTIDELIEHLKGLFSDDGTGRLTLSTVHKCKGLEWPRVFILDPNRMPSKWARQEWQQEQERNLIYVAYTRAREELCFVEATAIVDGVGGETA